MSQEKEKVQQAFTKAHYQMQSGCTNRFCLNPFCKANITESQTPNKIAIQILEHYKSSPGLNLYNSSTFIFCEEPKIILEPRSSYDSLTETEVLVLFTDPRSLGSSFKDQSKKMSWSSVEAIFARAAQLTKAGVLMKDWVLQSLKNLYHSKYSSLFIPQCLGVILASPVFADVEHMDLAEGIRRICGEGLAELSKIMDSYPEDIVHKVNGSLKQIVSINIIQNPEQHSFKQSLSALEILQCLYESNERKKRIPFKEFYIDAINSEEFDFKQDFKNWFAAKKSKIKEKSSFFHFPWTYNANSKSYILAMEIKELMVAEIKNSFHRELDLQIFVFLEVDRHNLIEDTLTQLTSGELNLRKPLKIHFKGEEGIDEGGVKKEFFQLIIKEIFDPNFGMFTYYEDQRFFWFNPDTIESGINFELIGKILGLAIYNSIILDVHLPMVTYKKILGLPTGIQDLEEFNPSLVNGLKGLLEFQGNVEQELCRQFYLETTAFGELVKHELKRNGESIPVTNENKKEYVDLFVDWWLNKGVERQFREFKNGFLKICGGDVLGLFKAEELELMVCGNPVLDFMKLEEVTRYEGYTKESATVKYFWEIIHGFSEEQKRKFLCFVTGSDRAPINGLGHMDLIISRTGGDTDRLMTAHTCFNYLVLPEYKNKEIMKKLMITAIENAAGFGLR